MIHQVISKKTRKILITGATGFIGKHLYQKLKMLNHNVKGISLEGGTIGNDKIAALDITNREAVKEFFDGKTFDIIFHLAAFIPKAGEGTNKGEETSLEKCLRVNGLGTYSLLLASKENGVKKFVYSSSASVYSREQTPMSAKEEHACPDNIYGISKLVGENICEIFRRKHHLKTVSLRYASVYGKGQEPYCVLPIFIERALRNEDIEVFGSGRRTQDFVYVKDVVRANIKAAFSRAEGIFNIGSGKETTMLELAQVIRKIFPESKGKIEKKPVEEKDKSHLCLDINKAKNELEFLARYSLEKGLRDLKKMIYENRDNR